MRNDSEILPVINVKSYPLSLPLTREGKVGGYIYIMIVAALFVVVGCDHPARVDIGELVEALNGLDKDEVTDVDEIADEILVDEDFSAEDGEVEGDKDVPDSTDVSDSADVTDTQDVEVLPDTDAVEQEPDVVDNEEEDGENCLVPDEIYDENDVEPDVDVVVCGGDFPNEHDGLCWSDRSLNDVTWDDAKAYCEALGGRLPTIDELRFLVQNCSSSETDGACGVNGICLEASCQTSCNGCVNDFTGLYSVFDDIEYFWSISEVPNDSQYAWSIQFNQANIGDSSKTDLKYARCVNVSTTWTDSFTGLMWQRGDGGMRTQPQAETYCDELVLNGHEDWRLPSINELRTLLHGCTGTETGGTCSVSDSDCLQSTCMIADCYACSDNTGPGEKGFYWESGIWDYNGNDFGWFWSTSVVANNTASAWFIEFSDGLIGLNTKEGHQYYSRCVSDADMTRSTKQWGGVASEYGHGVAVDSNGNIFVAGRTDGSFDDNLHQGDVDIFITKWNADGTKAWTKQLGSGVLDYGWSVAVDQAGNAFVTGWTQGDLDGNTKLGSDDVFLTKWEPDGTKAWTKQWGTEKSEKGYSVATDSDGNVYVVGYTYGTLGAAPVEYEDVFLTKWNADGTLGWNKQWGTHGHEQAYGVAVASDGSIYVTGRTDGAFDGYTNAGYNDIFLTKWNATGTGSTTVQWGTASEEGGNSVTTDSDGNVYVAGFASGGGSDIYLAKLNSVGSEIWHKQWGSGLGDTGESVAVSAYGDIFITGYTDSSFDGNEPLGGRDIFLTKYSTDGTRRWTKQWGATQEDIGYGVAIDPNGRIIVAGSTHEALDGNTYLGEVDAFVSIFSLE